MRYRILVMLGIFGMMLSCVSGGLSAGEDEFHVRRHRAMYWNQHMSQRARGLGGSFAALSNGASGVNENPAGLGAQTDREISFDLGFDEVDKGGDHATLISISAGGAFNINACAPEYFPRDNMGNMTAGFMLRHSEVNFSDNDGLESGLDGIALAYGRSFRGGKFYGGISFSYDEGDYNDDDRRIDTDIILWEIKLGGIYRVSTDLAIGATMAFGRGNITGNGVLDSADGDRTLIELRVGAACQLTPETLLVADILRTSIDNDLEDDFDEEHSIWRLSAGIEHQLIPDSLRARGGLYYMHDSYYGRNAPSASMVDDYAGITGGLSYFKDMFEVGYTLDIRTTGEVGHFLRFELDW